MKRGLSSLRLNDWIFKGNDITSSSPLPAWGSNHPSSSPYNFGPSLLTLTSTSSHHGTLSGIPLLKSPLKPGFLFSKNALNPSCLSSVSYSCTINSESNRCAPSALGGPLHIISLIKYVLTVLVCDASWDANSRALDRTASGEDRSSWNRSPK